jgi:hypothetical protein
MGLESARQRLIALAIALTFLALVAFVAGWIVTSLSDANVKSLGTWLDTNGGSIRTGAVAAIPAVATYMFGRRGGRKAGKTEAYNSAIATVEGKPDTATAAETLRQEARGHNLNVTVRR